MTFKEMLIVAGGCLTLMGAGYAAALKGQWIVDGTIAKAIAQEVLKDEELARMEFQLEYKQNQLRSLQRTEKAERSEEDQDAIDDLKADIHLLRSAICESKGRNDCKE